MTAKQDWLRSALGLHGEQHPFPWQEELLSKFLNENRVFSLDIPTGLGKTAVMAIWLVARAQGAMLPRRLVYVVDRRAVVDQATTEAERLRDWVEANDDVKQALGLAGPLPISTLRGQHVDNREWLEDPASPAIIVGTVNMVGSRLLFEGYGISRKMRPYHAGLLGADTLVVLDEAHLVPPFERLLEGIANCPDEFGPSDGALEGVVPRLRLMSLSATGGRREGETIGLTDYDVGDAELGKRLHARKRLRLKPLASSTRDSQDGGDRQETRESKPDLAAALAREAWELTAGGTRAERVIVFCDSREVAGRTKSEVEKLSRGDSKAGKDAVKVDTELFVGGRRVFERENARKRLEELGFLAGSNVARAMPAFLFATSAAEVGVDLDADHMVCDLVAWERMVQRLGRVNRRGGDDRLADVVVVVEPEPKNIDDLLKKNEGERSKKESQMVERVERARSVRKAVEALPIVDEAWDASPGALRGLKLRSRDNPDLNKVLEDATTPPPLRPALTRALVDAWSMTSLDRHNGRPAIEPWLRGWAQDDAPQTIVVWRRHLPVRRGAIQPSGREIGAFFEAAPPHASECLETETFRVSKWLRDRGKRLLILAANGAERLPDSRDIVAFVLAPDGDLRRSLSLKELADSERNEQVEAVLIGATLIVDARLAGLKDGLLDVAENAVPRVADDGLDWLGEGIVRFRVRPAAADEATVRDPNWRERLRFAAELSDEGEALRWLVVDKWRHDAATEEDRSAAHLQALDVHQSRVEEHARALARRLGLAKTYEETLAVSAALHDEGKRAGRWQRSFNAPAGGPYAKTMGPINYTLLDGYRHELGSLARAQSDERIGRLPAELRDLALHLIAAHHGFGRPVIGTSGCEDAPPSAMEGLAREVALRFARLQRRWGPWGLAWWEALLRAADQQASRDNDDGDAATGSEVA